MHLSQPKKPSRAKRCLGALVLLALAASGLFAARTVLLGWAGHLLVRDDSSDKNAPYAVLLMGDGTSSRARQACDLYKASRVRKIVFAQEAPSGFVAEGYEPGSTQVHAAWLAACGVKPNDIVVLKDCLVSSTTDEARCMRAFLTSQASHFGTGEAAKAAGITRAIVVTSWYHSSRAGWTFERMFAGTDIDIVTAPAGTSDRWWTREESFLGVFEEYLKWAYWLTRSL